MMDSHPPNSRQRVLDCEGDVEYFSEFFLFCKFLYFPLKSLQDRKSKISRHLVFLLLLLSLSLIKKSNLTYNVFHYRIRKIREGIGFWMKYLKGVGEFLWCKRLSFMVFFSSSDELSLSFSSSKSFESWEFRPEASFANNILLDWYSYHLHHPHYLHLSFPLNLQ